MYAEQEDDSTPLKGIPRGRMKKSPGNPLIGFIVMLVVLFSLTVFTTLLVKLLAITVEWSWGLIG